VRIPMLMLSLDEARSLAAAIKEIEASTDRGAAIIAGAFVEDHLRTALRGRLRQDKPILDEMFNSYGPLSSFSTKIKLAYLIGVISEETASDLDYIRKIRNKFAHRTEIDSFSSPPVKDWAMNLTLVDRFNMEIAATRDSRGITVTASFIDENNRPLLKTPRGRFVLTCQCLLSMFTLDEPPALDLPAF